MMTSDSQILPWGTWPSPIGAEQVAYGAPRRAESSLHNNALYWLESLADESGRVTLFRASADGAVERIVPQPFSLRSKVHEYGGGCYDFLNNRVFFVNGDDQEIYSAPLEGQDAPEPVTQASEFRYADLIADPARARLIAVAERHSDNGVENLLVAISLDGRIETLREGSDFYAYPRLNHDGSSLCWIEWQHPQMPWDDTDLCIAELDDIGAIVRTRKIKKAGEESIVQPLWHPNGELFFVSDRSDWWNLYRVTADELSQNNEPDAQVIVAFQAEFATPLWVFRMQNYALYDEHTLFASFTENGFFYCALIDIESGETTRFDTRFGSIESVSAESGSLGFISADASSFPTVQRGEIREGRLQLQPVSRPDPIDTRFISCPRSLQFPTGDRAFAHAFFYAPYHPEVEGNGAPPVIVLCHGGPTGQTQATLNYKIQYWTSRGFAVVDVNYRGSTGYGRRFRHALYRHWGQYDVEDCCAVVQYLGEQGLADPQRCIIKGSSAGGYTVLAALAFTQQFKVGVSLYGIGDLHLLAQDTHKFEAHYLDQLIAPYHSHKSLYSERSPLYAADAMRCALLLFQGLDDKVVPPNQAETMAKALRERGLPVALVNYIGEGHGFRKPETVQHMLEAEAYFYQRIFDLPHASGDAPIHIENLD